MRFPVVVFLAVDLLSDSQSDFPRLPFYDSRNVVRNFAEIEASFFCEYEFALDSPTLRGILAEISGKDNRCFMKKLLKIRWQA